MAAIPVVLALVPERRGIRLAAALRPDFDVLWLPPEADLVAGADTRPAAMVLDPLLVAPAAECVEGALRRLGRAVPLVFYTELTLDAMHRVFDLRNIAGACLVLAGIEDTPAALRRAVTRAGVAVHRLRAAEELCTTVSALPPDVADGLTRMLVSPEGGLTVHRLARLLNVSPRTLERHVAAAGVPSAARLVRTARALLARQLLCSSTLTAAEIARDVGYAKPESLRALTRWSFGSSPSSLRMRYAGPGSPIRRGARVG